MKKSKAKSVVVCLICAVLSVGFSNCTKERANVEAKPDPVVKSVLNIIPPGQFVQGSEQPVNELRSFTAKDKVIATYYFYWYNTDTKAHIINGNGTDALTHHPPTMQGFSYENVDWHKQELLDMIDAGIDIVLPVYWGDSGNLAWSIAGLKKLVEACQTLKSEGVNPPRIGMFYDTSSLLFESILKKGNEKPDLTSAFGKEYFYKLIRDFFSIVPPDLRARINGKPIVWLYGSGFAEKYGQETFDFADKRFSMDFGGKDLYIVREKSWANATSENIYGWGAALSGINSLGITAIGPGYDDRAVPGRTTPIRERKDGQFYIDSWNQALMLSAMDSTKNIIVTETWNEYHEGTDIANSSEYGRQYIGITSKYASYFKESKMPDDFPGKEFSGADKVFITFEQNGDNNGISYAENDDGKNSVTMVEGVPCLKPEQTQYSGLYVYFQINIFFKLNRDNPIYRVRVEYYDSTNTGFAIDYDSNDKNAPLEGAYKQLKSVLTTGTNTWKEASFELTDAKFAGRQNGGADFRIQALNIDLRVKRVSVEII